MTDWFYAVDGVQHGPASEDAVRTALAEKRVGPDDLVWTDGMPEWIPARRVVALTGGSEAPFFSVGIVKFVLMNLATLTLYQIYWFYKHWWAIRRRTGEELWPLARAIFAVFFFHAMQVEVEAYASSKSVPVARQKVGLTVLFFLLQIAWRLPDPFWLIGFATIVPLALAQHQVNRLHAVAVPFADGNRRIRGWNWLAIVLGLPFLAMALVGTFMGK
ncbi:MAG: hypothetical protein QOH21_2971 [Acidobacteriota bacterium]|nr:hypothetical protein [Acidobacteriota bacterium]